jgi:hypothetical protein
MGNGKWEMGKSQFPTSPAPPFVVSGALPSARRSQRVVCRRETLRVLAPREARILPRGYGQWQSSQATAVPYGEEKLPERKSSRQTNSFGDATRTGKSAYRV